VYRRVDRKGCGVDRLVALDDFTGFGDENEVRDAYLREVRTKWIEPWVSLVSAIRNATFLRRDGEDRHTEVICKNWIPDTYMPSNTFIEASFGKHSVRCCKMLLSIQALVLEPLKCRIFAYLQCLPRFCPAHCGYHLVVQFCGAYHGRDGGLLGTGGRRKRSEGASWPWHAKSGSQKRVAVGCNPCCIHCECCG
jgi:hypothetical protein